MMNFILLGVLGLGGTELLVLLLVFGLFLYVPYYLGFQRGKNAGRKEAMNDIKQFKSL